MSLLDEFKNGNLDAVKNDVAAVDLSSVAGLIDNFQYRQYFLEAAGREHYRLISWLSSQFPNQTVMDIGTHFGNSSVAMSFDKNVKVVSYDIVEMKQLTKLPENVEYKIGDFREDPITMASPFIFVDVDPHDGVQEKNFHQFFLESQYKGITLWDDINCNDAMRDWWNSLANDSSWFKKVDVTQLGHWSGTGMIIYNG